MGIPMARSLRAKIPASAKLIICELVESQIEKFLELTERKDVIDVAQSPKEVAERAVWPVNSSGCAEADFPLTKDIVITMLPQGPHVKEVFTSPETGLLAASTTRSILFLDCSTIDTATSLAVNKLATEAGHRFVDAPVSGGPSGADAATLTFMIGGSSELFDEVRPVAEAMGKKENIYHCGGAGAGLATKQINNYLSAVCILGTCEAFNMGRLYGLDPKILASVINVSTGMNYNSSAQNPVKGVTPTAAAARDFEGGFSIELCTGVVEMAVQLGKQLGARSLLGDIVLESFETASEDERCRGKDCRSIYRWFADL